ncbi:MAG: acyl-CoA dehydrogenase family protein [Vampirovibrionia bacterium]
MTSQFHLNQMHSDYQASINAYLQNINTSSEDEILKQLASDGYISLPSNEDSKASDYLSLSLAVEEISKQYPAVSNKVVELLFAQETIKRYACQEHKDSCSLKVAKLDVKINVLFTEPGNYGAAKLSTKVQKTDNGYKVQGTKVFVKENEGADKYLVAAKLVDGDKSELVLVGVDADKVSIVKKEISIGASKAELQVAEIDVEVESEKVITGVSNEMREALCVWRTLIASSSVGLAYSYLSASLGTMKTNKDSDNQALTSSQAVQFTLADIFGEIEGARSVAYYSSALIDAGTPSVRFSSIAKVQAAEAVVFASNKASDLIGSVGVVDNPAYLQYLNLAYNRQMKDGTPRNSYNVIYEEALARR